LVRDGAKVLGPAPAHSPTLKGYPDDDTAIQTRAKSLWQTITDGPPHAGLATTGISPEQMLSRMGIAPDATFARLGGAKGATAWIHRTFGDTDIYFVSNQGPRSAEIDCSFRIGDKAPQLWHPETGLIEDAPIWREENGRTTVTTRFEPAGS